MSYLKFEDYRGRSVELSEPAWEHIRGAHPEVTLGDLRSVLQAPSEVRESLRLNGGGGVVEVFHRTKAHPEGKPRFTVVVVKVLKDGIYISTAMTTSALKAGRTIYRKSAEKGEER